MRYPRPIRVGGWATGIAFTAAALLGIAPETANACEWPDDPQCDSHDHGGVPVVVTGWIDDEYPSYG